MTVSVRGNVETQEPTQTTGGNVKWHSHCEKQFRGSSKGLKYNHSMIQ